MTLNFWCKFQSKVSFFFFPGKVCGSHTHSISEVGRKKKTSCFFFSGPKFPIFSLFFFFSSGKVYTALTHSKSKAGKKETAPEKKNNFFTHSLEFCQKVAKNKLFRGKKNTVPLPALVLHVLHLKEISFF